MEVDRGGGVPTSLGYDSIFFSTIVLLKNLLLVQGVFFFFLRKKDARKIVFQTPPVSFHDPRASLLTQSRFEVRTRQLRASAVNGLPSPLVGLQLKGLLVFTAPLALPLRAGRIRNIGLWVKIESLGDCRF